MISSLGKPEGIPRFHGTQHAQEFVKEDGKGTY